MMNWLIIVGMGVITYAIRLAPIVLLERFELSPQIRQALKFVPVAVLSAIIVPELVLVEGDVVVWGNGRLLAGVVAAVVAWRTKNVLWTIAVGMVVLWLWTWAGNR
jgi:branched-subunit amino acid transport protein